MIHIFGHRWVVEELKVQHGEVIMTERCRLCKMERDRIEND